MKYALKAKFWSWGDDFTIRDDQGNDCYQVKRRIFIFGDKLSFQDMNGNEIAFISQRLMSSGPTYEVTQPGKENTVITKELFTFFSCKFQVDGPGNQDYEASGDLMDHEYEISRFDHLVARISKRWFSFNDSYGIEIADDEDQALLLCAAVVIDIVCHDSKK